MAVVLRQWYCFKRWKERAERDRGYCSSLPFCPPSFFSTVFLSFLSSLFPLSFFFNLLCFISSFLSLFSSPLLFFLFFYFSLSASPPFILIFPPFSLFFKPFLVLSPIHPPLLFYLVSPCLTFVPPLLFFFPFSPLFIGGQGRERSYLTRSKS